MKKVIAAIAAIMSMMIMCAFPFMVRGKADAAQMGIFTSVQDTPEYSQITANDLYYIFFNKGGYTFIFTVNQSDFERMNIVSANGQINITGALRFTQYVSVGSSYSLELLGAEFHTDTNIAIGYDLNSQQCLFDAFQQDDSEFSDFDTNIPEIHLHDLDLSISFQPSMSGQISRTQVINGKEYVSSTCDLHITNNGENAQFAWFIVPHGQSISFPTTQEYNTSGFVGNPVFAYITDEWTDFSAGFSADTVYAPSAWHCVPAGYVNQIYHVSWSSMMLSTDTQYDCLVYATLTHDSIDTTSYNPNFDMRSVYSVSSDLSGVELVYSSTFTITDPANFVADSDGFDVHPWNPNIDNSDMFNTSSAHKDSNGNIFIKSEQREGSNIAVAAWGDADQSMNNIFRNYFLFLNSAMNCFPKAFINILTLGLSGLVILGIIKVVTH